jgi:hypothetical protein
VEPICNSDTSRLGTPGEPLPPPLQLVAIVVKISNYFVNLVHNHCYPDRTHARKYLQKNLRSWWKQNKLHTNYLPYPQPHKAQDLQGHGRGWIRFYKKLIQQNLYQLNLLSDTSKKPGSQKTNSIKAHSLPGSGRSWSITSCVCYVYWQVVHTSFNMASSSAKRQILQQDQDLMEIDAPQASKRTTDKDKDTTSRTASGKKSKLDKPKTNVTIPVLRPPRY